MKQEILNKYLKQNILLEVYSKTSDPDRFLLGYLVKDAGNFCIFESIDEYGALDGYSLYAKADIAKILTNTSYTKIFESNIKTYQQFNAFDPFNLKEKYNHILQKTNFTPASLLNYYCQHGNVITLSIAGYDYPNSGKVIAVSDNFVSLDEMTHDKDLDYDFPSQNKPLEIRRITALDIVSKDNFLYEQYKKSS
ncbi:hypothetical protein PT285_10825 [Lactobacillus sp. ESL0791]|uniref:hypothetical protein n=1 Tax=Lactobacillus sp. ESL0791 TaxID=2983234 RepID=UPI0023F8E81A|nr:hypothetical protein [Lactobacillus sp. ESL0791]MDF7639893.1 hypothetical protein [Lactobacillus sp. ESL0791]